MKKNERVSNYGMIEIIKHAYYVIRNKLEFHNVRLIRYPIVVRGKKYIDFGNYLTTGYRCRFEVCGTFDDKRIIFGDNVVIGDNVRISCCEKIIIGNNVLMGSHILIIDNSHGYYKGNYQDSPFVPPNKRKMSSEAIIIEDNVWIGENVVIQKGVKIGFGSIVAANSVVTKDVPSLTIVGGMPLKEIKRWDGNRWC